MGLTARFVAIKETAEAGAFVRSMRSLSVLAPPGWSVFKEGLMGRWVEDAETELDRRMRGFDVPFWCAWVEGFGYAYIFGGKGGLG